MIALWKRDGKIGKYSDVVRYNVEMKLSEQNPAYKGRGIALEHAKLGAQAPAAAATLSGQISFLLLDESIPEKVKLSSIDSADILQGWSSEELNALLSTALFDESLYGTVRFHHRTAREYLCACWLARLLDKRKNRRQIEELLFARPYGTERLVVRPAMKPVAAWLALTDQDVRDQVMNADPRVLLEHGDASALDIGTRTSLLKLVANRYRDRNHTPIRMDNLKASSISGKGRHQHPDFVQGSGEMTRDEYVGFTCDWLSVVQQCCSSTALIYSFIDWRHLMEMTVAGHSRGMELYQIITWVKSNGGMGGIYRNQSEFICVFRAGKDTPRDNVELGRRGRNRTNVWNYPGMSSFGKERDSLLGLHPTVKPVAMIADAVRDVTKRGEIVLDCFLGSGSSLMAADETGRICCGIELDPRYVDVAVRRWQNATGREAVLLSTGEPFNVFAERRLAGPSEPDYGK